MNSIEPLPGDIVLLGWDIDIFMPNMTTYLIGIVRDVIKGGRRSRGQQEEYYISAIPITTWSINTNIIYSDIPKSQIKRVYSVKQHSTQLINNIDR